MIQVWNTNATSRLFLVRDIDEATNVWTLMLLRNHPINNQTLSFWYRITSTFEPELI